VTKKLLRVLHGEPVWPPPIWLMRQAGRYLPEFRAIKDTTPDFIDRCTDPALAAEITLQPLRRFPLDAAILFSDILMLPWALGHGLLFGEGEGPVMPQVTQHAQVDALDLGKVSGAIAPIIETVRRVRRTLEAEHPEAAFIGFAGSPFTVACYMVDGRGGKEFPATRQMAYADPELFTRLVDRLTEATEHYLAAQIEAGAETVMLFDSWAGLLSPRLFRAHVIAPTRRLVTALKARFPNTPIIGFPRLAGLLAASYAAETGVDALGLDSSVDPALVAPMIPARVALQGNLDPLAVVAGGAGMAEEVAIILKALRGRPHIFNLGHGIVPHTPPEHVAALVEQVRAG
jgi:uroporphyrinogen decarboxylase